MMDNPGAMSEMMNNPAMKDMLGKAMANPDIMKQMVGAMSGGGMPDPAVVKNIIDAHGGAEGLSKTYANRNS